VQSPPLVIQEDPGDAALTSPLLFDLSRLKTKPYPEGVDPEHLERHMKTAEFHQAFKVSRTGFEKLPKWKQLTLKKAIELF